MTRYTVIGAAILFFLCVVTLLIVSSRDTAKPVGIVKADKLTADLPMVANPVKPVRIAAADDIPRVDIMVPEPKAPPQRELLEANQPADTLRPPAPAARRDPCARWGGHKISTHGGRHWHCRY
jgi:hypothetical protein